MIQFDRSDVYDFPGMVGISEPVSGFAENFFAARDNMRLNDQSQSKELILKDLWTPIVEEMREAFPNQGFLGRDFENPADFLGIGLGVYSTAGGPQDRYNFAVNNLLTFMDENQESLPDHLKGITLERLEQNAKETAQAARKDAEEIGARNLTFKGTVGQFTGGVSGLVDDPINAIGLMGASAKNLWRLAFTEAAIGAGTGAVAEAGVAKWYDELGYDYTYQDFLRNVAYNAVGSAAFGVGIRVSADAAKSGWSAISKSGQANKNSQALADAAEARQELEADNPLDGADLPPAQAEHTSRATTAEAAVENNTAPAMPNETTIQPTPEIIEAATDNLNGVMFSVNPRDVNVDAKRFQFKEGGDEYGVTERLQGVTEWDPIKAGTVIFWEDVDGKMFVADGHQRVGLARRIQAQKPDEKIEIIGYKLRETDGVSAEKARVIAAMANIAQGTGTAIDAAKVLRVEPGRIAELPPQSVLVRQARDLVNLSNQAFGAIVNEVIPSNYGAIVGRLIDDPDLQEAAIGVLAKSDPSNLFQAEAIVRQVREMDTVQETQVSLFGEEVITGSLFTERARVLDRTTKLLRGDKKAFESLSKNAERIEAEGNKLAKDQNQRRADQDAQAITLLQALANRKGVLSDDLSGAARTARETGNYAEAARNFADAVRRGIERGDFDGASTGDVGRAVDVAPQSRADAIEQEPTLEGFDEATGPAAEAQVNQMELDTYREMDVDPEAGSLDDLKRLLEGEPTREQIDRHPAVTKALDEMTSKPETIDVDGYGSSNWHDNRAYRIDDEDVLGTENALSRFEQSAEALAFKELKIDAQPVARDKELTIVLGPPAAGKSMIANELAVANRSAILDSDEIKKALPEYESGVGASAVHEESSELAQALQSLMIARGTNIVLPKVGHSVSSVRKVISLYKEQGYKIRLVNMNVTPESAYQRMIMRFVKTGRIIPPSYLDAVGANPTLTYRTLKQEGIADGYAEIDNNGGFKDPKEITDISGDNPLTGSRFDFPVGGRTGEGAIRRSESDSEEFSLEIEEAEMDLEIPVGMRVDGEDVTAEVRTLREIKADLDAEDAMINRLGVCGL